MGAFSVRIELNKHVPAPALPRNIDQPVDVSCVSLEGQEWMWDGRNVALVTIPGPKIIRGQIAELKAMWAHNGLRPVRADEFVQLFDHTADWPPAWLDRSIVTRILFAGTVYTLKYPDETYERIFAARYDQATSEWIIENEDTSALLCAGDRFACVLDNPNETVAGWTLKNSRSFPRRASYLPEHRPFSIRMRYGG